MTKHHYTCTCQVEKQQNNRNRNKNNKNEALPLSVTSTVVHLISTQQNTCIHCVDFTLTVPNCSLHLTLPVADERIHANVQLQPRPARLCTLRNSLYMYMYIVLPCNNHARHDHTTFAPLHSEPPPTMYVHCTRYETPHVIHCNTWNNPVLRSTSSTSSHAVQWRYISCALSFFAAAMVVPTAVCPPFSSVPVVTMLPNHIVPVCTQLSLAAKSLFLNVLGADRSYFPCRWPTIFCLFLISIVVFFCESPRSLRPLQKKSHIFYKL